MHMIQQAFFSRTHFPAEAIAALASAEEKLRGTTDMARLQERLYLQDAALWTDVAAAAKQAQVHPFTADLVLLLQSMPEAKARYLASGLSEELFWDSMKDIYFKMMETHYIHGIWGVYCGYWLVMLLRQQCICLGRQQYEPVPSHCDCTIAGHVLRKGDPVLNVHIPSFGKLRYEDVLDSYHRAEVFFRDRFPQGLIWIQAETWILYPPVNAMLPEGNLRRWSEDYQVVHACIDPTQDDRYRIFHLPNGTPMEQYPQNNPLQCRLKAWLQEGNTMGIGFGYLLIKDGVLMKG